MCGGSIANCRRDFSDCDGYSPGATAYLLTDKFKTLSIIAIILGAVTSFIGVYISYYLDGATGGVIVTLQTLLFLAAFLFSPKYGLLTRNKKGGRKCLIGFRTATI